MFLRSERGCYALGHAHHCPSLVVKAQDWVLVVQAITAIILSLQCAAEFIIQCHVAAVYGLNHYHPTLIAFGRTYECVKRSAYFSCSETTVRRGRFYGVAGNTRDVEYNLWLFIVIRTYGSGALTFNGERLLFCTHGPRLVHHISRYSLPQRRADIFFKSCTARLSTLSAYESC